MYYCIHTSPASHKAHPSHTHAHTHTLEKSTGSQVQPRELAQHKALLGISVDPQDGNRLASYAEVGRRGLG